jgi:hypothetical protein
MQVLGASVRVRAPFCSHALYLYCCEWAVESLGQVAQQQRLPVLRECGGVTRAALTLRDLMGVRLIQHCQHSSNHCENTRNIRWTLQHPCWRATWYSSSPSVRAWHGPEQAGPPAPQRLPAARGASSRTDSVPRRCMGVVYGGEQVVLDAAAAVQVEQAVIILHDVPCAYTTGETSGQPADGLLRGRSPLSALYEPGSPPGLTLGSGGRRPIVVGPAQVKHEARTEVNDQQLAVIAGHIVHVKQDAASSAKPSAKFATIAQRHPCLQQPPLELRSMMAWACHTK